MKHKHTTHSTAQEYGLLIDSDGEIGSLKLTQEEYEGVERLLQWPEDLEAYDRLNSPTILNEIIL